MRINYLNEIWKDIKGYEGLYQVSNFGRVKSLKRNRIGKNNSQVPVIERIRKQSKDKEGYLRINLCKDDKYKWHLVHRLVAETFIPNPDNLPCVNHKDENKQNNVVWINEDGSIDYDKTTIEWCSYSYNNTYGTRLNRVSEKQLNGKKSKPVYQYDLEGNFIKEWDSLNEIRRTKQFDSCLIGRCCNNKPYHNTAYGYIWKFKETA